MPPKRITVNGLKLQNGAFFEQDFLVTAVLNNKKSIALSKLKQYLLIFFHSNDSNYVCLISFLLWILVAPELPKIIDSTETVWGNTVFTLGPFMC